MAKANFLTDADGNKMYPYAHADATYTNTGAILGTELSNVQTKATNLETNKANKNSVLSSVNDCALSTNASDIAGASAIKELNTSLVSKISGSNYVAVDGLGYDATNKKLMLKVGADAAIPFSGKPESLKLIDTKSASVSNQGYYRFQFDEPFVATILSINNGSYNSVLIKNSDGTWIGNQGNIYSVEGNDVVIKSSWAATYTFTVKVYG